MEKAVCSSTEHSYRVLDERAREKAAVRGDEVLEREAPEQYRSIRDVSALRGGGGGRGQQTSSHVCSNTYRNTATNSSNSLRMGSSPHLDGHEGVVVLQVGLLPLLGRKLLQPVFHRLGDTFARVSHKNWKTERSSYSIRFAVYAERRTWIDKHVRFDQLPVEALHQLEVVVLAQVHQRPWLSWNAIRRAYRDIDTRRIYIFQRIKKKKNVNGFQDVP